MFRLSTLDANDQRTLVLEGKLIAPWTEEVELAWRQAREHFEGHKLIVDLTNVTLIGREGENTLLHLMRDGARFAGCGVLTKHTLKQLARKCRCER
jgi:hypothetical protein